MAYTNVGFLKGSQSNLNNLMSNGGAKEGIFYLTEDTHRLYIGHNTGTSVRPVPVNEGIQFVQTQSNLPAYVSQEKTSAPEHAGEFYYISGSNVLCVWNGTRWVQINPNTNDNTYIDDFQIEVEVNNGVATITSTAIDNEGNEFRDNFSIKTEKGLTAKIDGHYKVATGNFDAQTIYFSKSDEVYTRVDNLTEEQYNNGTYYIYEEKGIILSGDTYTINTTANSNNITLTLDSTTQTDSNVLIEAGDHITLDNKDGGFEISADDTQIDTGSGSLTISNVENDGNGFDFSFSVSDTEGNSASDSEVFNPTITVGAGSGAQSTNYFVNGDASLPVYTISEIDSKFQILNSMHYIGTLKSNGGTAATSITGNIITGGSSDNNDLVVVKKGNNNVVLHIGDTILVAEQTTINGITYEKGTLLVASGTEDTNSASPTYTQIISDLKFDVIEESYDTDTTYQLTGTTTGFKLVDDDNSEISAITFSEGTSIGISCVPSGINNVNDTITISHADVSRSDPSASTSSQDLGTSYTKTVVTGVTTNAQGHVTAVNTEQMTWTNTNGDIDNVTITNDTVTAASGKPKTEGLIDIAVQFVDSDGSKQTAKSDKMIVASETLAIDTYTSDRISGASKDKVGLSIELQWGSF